jgi:hypothetical protein
VEDGIGWVSGNLLEELTDPLGLGRELEVLDKRSVKINGVKGFETRRILDQRG